MTPIKGRMAVYTKEHRLKESRIYYSSDGMKKIMSEWFTDYPGHYIQVQPYVEGDKPPKQRLEIKEDDAPERLRVQTGRPPANYDNLKTYNY